MASDDHGKPHEEGAGRGAAAVSAADLARGREAFARRAWAEAHEALGRADAAAPLPAEELERLATAALLCGRDDAFLSAMERAYGAHAEAGRAERAAQCAFWLAERLANRGEVGQAGGWLGRAGRLLEGRGEAGPAHGYLLLPAAMRQFGAGELEAAEAGAARAAALAQRHGDADLLALALHLQGRVRLRGARVQEGLALLDEALLAVATGELSPVVTGIVYCSAIAACREVWALGRAREWVEALAAWCDAQPELVPFAGRCRALRAEILQLRGAWADAVAEARRAGAQVARGGERDAAAAAAYQEGEVHRLRGETDAAEAAYREASRLGREPLPGLALLRLAQGRRDDAAATLRRALAETPARVRRAGLLPARVEIALAAGALDEAREACRELAGIAADFDMPALHAIAAHADGALRLADGDAAGALPFLRRAWRGWRELDAPYEAARARELMGRACRALGDGDGAGLELEAAREAYAALGAAPDLGRVEALLRGGAPEGAHGLSPRELEVLRLVAAGRTNKEVAARLELSEKTIDRHLSNIFDKLGVSSRTAATAFAYEHGLLG